MFELPSLEDVSEVVIDKQVVEKSKEPTIIRQSEKKPKSTKKAS